MPQLIALAAVGAAVYFGVRAARRAIGVMEQASRERAPRAAQSKRDMVRGGELKLDPQTGTYKVENEEAD